MPEVGFYPTRMLSEFNTRRFHALARECELTEINRANGPKADGGAVARPAVQIELATRIHRGEWRRPSWPRKAPVMARGRG
jgi:hypothetical protein